MASLTIRLPRAGLLVARSSCIAVRHASSLPRIASPSLWKAMIPKSLRQPIPLSEAAGPVQKTNEKIPFTQNPAVHLTIFGLLCGSLAIRVINLKSEIEDTRRMVESKIRLLDSVIRRLRSGEAVDVREALGTGDPEKEAEWSKGSCPGWRRWPLLTTIAVLEEIGDVSQWLREAREKPQQDKSRTGDLKSAAASAELPKLEQQTMNGVPKPAFY